MKITVKYFGMIAESVGKTEEVLDLQQGSLVKDLKDQKISEYKIPDADSVQIAVNQNLGKEVILKEGDEVAFLPPFAGG